MPGIAIDVHYQAAKDLGDVPIHMVLQSLRTKLGMPDLTLKAERIRPARGARDSRAAIPRSANDGRFGCAQRIESTRGASSGGLEERVVREI